MGSLSIWHWLIVLLVVVLIFGTKKLRNMGGDVGGAVKEFKNAMNDGKEVAEVKPAVAKVDAPQALVTADVVNVPTAKPKAAAKKPAAKPKAAATAKPKPAATKAKAPAKTVAKAPATKITAKKPAAVKPKTTTKVAAK